MIKASAGGGGKGMRIAWNDDEAIIGFRLSKEEAKSSFGDDRIFIEKFIEDPRHIEIQILADAYGNVCPFPERECSIQRRNQKVIEEAPSMLLDDATRQAMGEQAAMLARAVEYQSAGTVEFLVDKYLNFYFLEMNTRLQVEHPITEMISGVDLVEHMLWIAAGRELPPHLRGDAPLPVTGWAIESRVYAEDPFRGFLPSTGRLINYNEPEGAGVRIDTGVSEGSDISMFYDPMIAKLVTHGKDRPDAIQKMNQALDSYLIKGPGHNISFCREVCRHPKFIAGDYTTKFIEEEYPDGFSGVVLTRDEELEMLAISSLLHADAAHTSSTISGQLNQEPVESFTSNDLVVSVRDQNYHVYASYDMESDEGLVQLLPEGSTNEDDMVTIVLNDVSMPSAERPIFEAVVDGNRLHLQQLEVLPEGFRLQYCGAIQDISIRSPEAHNLSRHMIPKPEVDFSQFLLCPMPGQVVSVSVHEGEEVEVGQELAVVEAMKMQNVLRSEKKGKIRSIKAAAGDSLKVDEVILEFE